MEVVDYDPSWPQRFAVEAERFWTAVTQAVATDEVVAVEHVGSTAVPGLAAKAVLDVMVGLAGWPGLGRVHRRRGGSGLCASRKGRHRRATLLHRRSAGRPRTCHIHAVQHGGRFGAIICCFATALAREASTRTAYAQLKRDLAGQHPHHSLAYTDAKAAFVREVVRRTGAETDAATVHAAVSGFDTHPHRYERTRPGYPPAAVAVLVDQLARLPRGWAWGIWGPGRGSSPRN